MGLDDNRNEFLFDHLNQQSHDIKFIGEACWLPSMLYVCNLPKALWLHN